MPRVLVVEDEMIVAFDLIDTLERLGYEVVGPAATADAACAMAREANPDLVLMDVRLKGARDGIDAASDIVAELPVKVVFLTGENDAQTMSRAEPIQPAAWLAKPCSPKKIERVLSEVLMVA